MNDGRALLLSHNARRLESSRPILVTLVLCVLASAACGKKGPPLPPLVRLPAPPSALTAARRGDAVDLQLTVPAANTDNTRPANVSRVDVYAFTGPPTVSDADILKHGTRIAAIAVKAPRDPEATIDPDNPLEEDSDVDPPEGEGLDQGSVARLQEMLTASARAPSPTATPSAKRIEANNAEDRPLLGPPPSTALARTYISVAVTPKGKRGPSSRRVVVPLAVSPSSPSMPQVTYTETEVIVTWLPPPSAASLQAPADEGVLPAEPIGIVVPRLAYHVYETPAPSTTPAAVSDVARTPVEDTALTKTPIAEARYSDSRMAWGSSRCYAVRAVEILGALAVESEKSAPACIRLVDTFAPAAPKGLQAVPSGSGAIDLIWDANTEPDLEGYIVLRAASPTAMLARITPMPIRETNFHDMNLQPGVRYVYALQAVDKAGNLSDVSGRQEETVR